MNYIENIDIKNFLVFKKQFNVNFCPGINVLIGGNGSGKTTLLKVMYRLTCSSKYKHTEEHFFAAGRWNGHFAIRPFEHLRMEIYSNNAKQKITVKSLCCNFDDKDHGGDRVLLNNNWVIHEPNYFIDEYTQSHSTINGDCKDELVFVTNGFEPIPSIYIPSVDMLSHSNGLLEIADVYEMDFEATQIDIIRNAQRPVTRKLTPNCSLIIKKINKIINGEVIFDKGRFFVQKNNGQKVEFTIEASGFIRFGLLWKLLRNGLLESGTVLFWDEPDASINPEHIPSLVEILLELQRNGVQIFLATHSYDFARWLELNRTNNNSLRYVNMKHDGDSIYADVSDDYISLPNNVIENAGDALLRRVTEVAAKNAGVNLHDIS